MSRLRSDGRHLGVESELHSARNECSPGESDRARRRPAFEGGQETKAQQIYAYLTGPQFKHRVECISDESTELRKDLDAVRKCMTKQWARRDRELLMVLEVTSGMYGDL